MRQRLFPLVSGKHISDDLRIRSITLLVTHSLLFLLILSFVLGSHPASINPLKLISHDKSRGVSCELLPDVTQSDIIGYRPKMHKPLLPFQVIDVVSIVYVADVNILPCNQNNNLEAYVYNIHPVQRSP